MNMPPVTAFSAPSGKVWTNSIGMEFVKIPAGSFWMGSGKDDEDASDLEKPRHKVTISRPFYLGRYPVTQTQWEAVMGNNP
ncbi:MAG: SUMF1/EgtB/PvdO family nonheme iron enzyme, partial [Deltaproteobacteria bacterium]|nr:SUMF1/EgtB/PvdO family nonheme iron enzyme [Deltaproteobacteria bacterium]